MNELYYLKQTESIHRNKHPRPTHDAILLIDLLRPNREVKIFNEI